jgi:hypothetical protein
MFEDTDTEVGGGPPPEETNNRTFLIAAGVLGGLTLLSLICMAVYAIVIVPRNRSGRLTQAASIETQNAEIERSITQTALAASIRPTASPSPSPTQTSTTTPTPVVVEEATEEPSGPTGEDLTATVSFLLTLAAETQTVTPTATGLPDTGLVDDIGVPGLLAMALVLVAVIFLVRRMRSASV